MVTTFECFFEIGDNLREEFRTGRQMESAGGLERRVERVARGEVAGGSLRFFRFEIHVSPWGLRFAELEGTKLALMEFSSFIFL